MGWEASYPTLPLHWCRSLTFRCRCDNWYVQERYPDLARDENGKLITVPLEAVNLCFFTTIVTAGSGRGMVIGTGDR